MAEDIFVADLIRLYAIFEFGSDCLAILSAEKRAALRAEAEIVLRPTTHKEADNG